MNDSHHSSRTSRGSISTFLLPGIVLLPVLYVLSLGPMIMLASQGQLGFSGDPVFESFVLFYSPLFWCLEQEDQVLAPALEWYLELWIW